MGTDTHISIRVPEEVKKDLEELSRITGQNLSNLLRDIMLPLAKIRATIDVIETLEKAENVIIRTIVSLPEFQKLLERLVRFLKTETVAIGFSGEEVEEFRVLYRNYTIIRRDEKWFPAKVEEIEECNRYGSCWIAYIEEKEIRTIRELVDFLWEAEQAVSDDLKEKVENIKKAIRELFK